MSIADEQAIKRLNVVVEDLTKRVSKLEAAQSVIIEGADGTDPLLEELALRYEKKFGQPPHHRMKPETIIRALNE